jgi:putative hemolysin
MHLAIVLFEKEEAMPHITLEILIIFLLFIANGIFAMSEIAVVSARKVRLQERANKGDAGARLALKLANAPEDFLSSVQIGITLVGILMGALGGGTLAAAVAANLERVPLLGPYSQAFGVGIVVLSLTFLSLVIGELVPKRLALNSPERIASAMARPMRWMSVLASPAVRLLTVSTNVLLGILRVKPSTEPPVTEEEIQVLIEQGTQAGVFEEAEQDMVTGVFRLGDRQVSTIMTPRTEIVWLDLEDSPEETRRKITESAHTQFPVGQGSLDNILGVVKSKDLLTRCLAGQPPVDLKAVLQRPLLVPETKPVLQVIESFRESRKHIALVIDEYGGLQGMVTINDILEGIVGDLPAVGEAPPGAVQREDGSWLLDGLMPVDEFREILQIGELPGEDRGYYHTLGGFVMTHLGRIPSAADYFEWDKLRFEVVDMDGRRVDKVLVTPVEADRASE